MGLFSSRDKDIESLIAEIKNDFENNYKDNATRGVIELRKLINEKRAAGKLKDKMYMEYTDTLVKLEEAISNFKRTY